MSGLIINVLPWMRIMDDTEAMTAFVLEWAAKEFRSQRRLDQQFVMAATKPRPALMHVAPEGVGEGYAQSAWVHRAIRALAQESGARALYCASEVWFTSSTEHTAAMKSEPRLDPNRKEAVTVLLENPALRPPMQIWQALIERNKGRPRLRDWAHKDYTVTEGRLTYLLPQEAYGAAGSA